MMELARFFLVSVVGVAIDISIAFAIATLLGMPLWIAAAVGFLVAIFGNYTLHEVWTFRRESSQLSRKRALFYFVSSGVTLLSRLAVVAGLSAWISRDHALEILISGAAVSFFVNYVVSKFFVFPKRAEKQGNF